MNKRMWFVFAVCVLFSFSAGWAVSGSSLLEPIKSFLNKEIKLTLNGTPWEAKIDGKTKYPITYEGTTYLPVRAVAEALDIPIRWEEETRSVHIAEPMDAEAVYAGSVEAQTVAPGQTGVEREQGSGSVRFVQEKDGRLTFVLHGSVREEGDASMSITGKQDADGWSSSEPIEVKIDNKGNIYGGGVTQQNLPSPYRITFNGKILPETLQLRVELEPMNSTSGSYAFNYDLKRIASIPPADEDSGNTVTVTPDPSDGENTCKRIVWTVQNIANLSGGPMQMIQVPTCYKY